jgi:hypothetical protein
MGDKLEIYTADSGAITAGSSVTINVEIGGRRRVVDIVASVQAATSSLSMLSGGDPINYVRVRCQINTNVFLGGSAPVCIGSVAGNGRHHGWADGLMVVNEGTAIQVTFSADVIGIERAQLSFVTVAI